MPTMGMKHRVVSGFRKFQILSKLCLSVQVSSSEMPYVSYSGPLRRNAPANLSVGHKPENRK